MSFFEPTRRRALKTGGAVAALIAAGFLPRDAFAAATIVRVLQHLEQVLQGMAEGGGEGRVAALGLLGADERAQIDSFNPAPTALPAAANLADAFAAQVARTPAAAALAHAG
ncbi:MAG: hypothetical protein LCH62_00965, partial [Proteobacteria bacterium]|nr:hypothetical protein [Pseudomonadota bacterium]